MDRRTFLATAGIVTAAPLVGCLDAATADGDDPPARPWPRGESIEDSDGVHHLYVENHTDTTETAWLRVVREDGATLADGRYELPDGRGIEFESIAAWETTYTIELAIDGEEATSLTWHTDECGPGSEAPDGGGSRNAAVVVEEASAEGERLSLVVDQCDAISAGSVPTGSAGTFRLDA